MTWTPGWAGRTRTVELPAGRYETLMPPSTVADMMIYLAWTMDGRGAQEGRTALSAPGGTRVGERLTDLGLTLYSDPGAGGLECAPFVAATSSSERVSVFDNGLDIDRVDWIRDGAVNALAYPRAAAAEFGSPVAVPADNLLMTGGTASLADMIAATERGLLLTTLWYIREVDPTVLLLTGLTRDGVYLIEDGEVTGAVNNFRFNESPLDLLRRATEAGVSEVTLPREWGDWATRASHAVAADSRLPHVVGESGAIIGVMDDDQLYGMLTRLMALNPEGDGGRNALVRDVCAAALSLPPVAAQEPADDDPQLAEFAEQFAVDVSVITAEQRSAFMAALGRKAFRVAALIFIADFVPRMRAGVTALGFAPVVDPVGVGPRHRSRRPAAQPVRSDGRRPARVGPRDHRGGPTARSRPAQLPAVQVAARRCRARRGRERVAVLRHRAVRGVRPARRTAEGRAALRRRADLDAVEDRRRRGGRGAAHFSDAEALELTLDVMRNAANKIAVALGGDAPRVDEGTERYLLGVDGQPVYS